MVVLPTRRTDGEAGEYDSHSIALAKALREAGLRVDFLDPSESRTFEVRKSADLADIVINVAINIGTGLAGTAIWESCKAIITKFRQAHNKVDIRVHELYRSPAPQVEAISSTHRTEQSETTASSMPTPSAHVARMIKRLTLEGKALIGEAALSLKADGQDAESHARSALERLRSALDWAEDGPSESDTHAALDLAGRWVRETFGCRLAREGRTYSLTCPVRLAHTRVGLSIGGRAHRTCSLCGQDLSECEHVPGRDYLVPGGTADLGWCRVCLTRERCEHVPTQLYRAGVVSIIDQGDLNEISLVGKPAMPDARIHSQTVNLADLESALGPEFKPGMDVSCDFCLAHCSGLYRPFGQSAEI
ncbi:hypothetical protein [Raineyella sp. LH-20]|uniref:hypothetical protein n=1 Tax=Raineyella sp. LH-20 TaxID=3081204 RepID=UPI002953EF5F|nr:hypothetical protein [Raineyella sp. LH-20]WOP18288.1 hypothetical protein R0146_13790 [Raineyella sp. LH-20]